MGWEDEANKRNYDFTTQVDQIIINTQARLLAVVKGAISDVIEEAQTPTAKGGKMRVKTGFLRSTGIASLNAPVSGPDNGDKKAAYAWANDSISLMLLRLNFGDVFYFGWTAKYAKYREAYDGFLESALQKWQIYVDKRVAFYKDKDVGS